jgi:hypothetical protein
MAYLGSPKPIIADAIVNEPFSACRMIMLANSHYEFFVLGAAVCCEQSRHNTPRGYVRAGRVLWSASSDVAP